MESCETCTNSVCTSRMCLHMIYVSFTYDICLFYITLLRGFTRSSMCDVTHVNESCHTCEWVISQMWMSHVTHVTSLSHVTYVRMSRVTHVNESYDVHKPLIWVHVVTWPRDMSSCEGVMSLVKESRDIHKNFESCHVWKNHVTYTSERVFVYVTWLFRTWHDSKFSCESHDSFTYVTWNFAHIYYMWHERTLCLRHESFRVSHMTLSHMWHETLYMWHERTLCLRRWFAGLIAAACVMSRMCMSRVVKTRMSRVTWMKESCDMNEHFVCADDLQG